MAASMRTDKTVLILSLDIPGDAQTAREAVTGKRQDLSLVQPGFQGGEFGRAGRRGQREPSLKRREPKEGGVLPHPENTRIPGRQRAEGTLAATELWAPDTPLSINPHHSPARKTSLG